MDGKASFSAQRSELADASKSTRERTLRGRIFHCTAFCLVSQLHWHTVLCLTAIVHFLPGGSVESAEEVAWVGLKPGLREGTGFNLLRVQFWTPVQRKGI